VPQRRGWGEPLGGVPLQAAVDKIKEEGIVALQSGGEVTCSGEPPGLASSRSTGSQRTVTTRAVPGLAFRVEKVFGSL